MCVYLAHSAHILQLIQSTYSCMSSDTHTEAQVSSGISIRGWEAGAVGGLVGGVLMGAMIWLMNSAILKGAIPGLYGLEGDTIGWVAHVFHSVVLGLLFVVIVQLPMLSQYSNTVWTSDALGVVYGAVLWVVAAGFVMPFWLQSVGFAQAPPFPEFGVTGEPRSPHRIRRTPRGSVPDPQQFGVISITD